MKINLRCFKCSYEAPEIDQSNFAQITDSGVYEFTCPNKHRNANLLQNFKFELLFELGCRAFCEGYYREAISTFASARERFFEFYLEFYSDKSSIQFSDFWNEMKKQSERQYGAFLLAYTLENNKKYQFDDNKMTSLRNRVIHEGLIPNEEDALNFGEYVYNGIVSVVKEMKLKNENFLEAMLARDYGKKYKLINKQDDDNVTNKVLYTRINVIQDDVGNMPYRELIKQFREEFHIYKKLGL